MRDAHACAILIAKTKLEENLLKTHVLLVEVLIK
jgi:hypothetical protein